MVVAMENPNFSVIQIDGPDSPARRGKGHGRRSPKQLTWALILSARRSVCCIVSAVSALSGALKMRLSHGHRVVPGDDKPEKPRRLLKLISGFLVLCLAAALLIKLSAYWKGWRFHQPELRIEGWTHSAYLSWLSYRAAYIACPVQVLSKFCIVLFVVQSADRIILCLGCFWIKLKRIKPRIEEDAIKGDCEFPMVLVQIPMCNEREVINH